MHSYETLAVVVLALSTATPAFSAPVLESQQQARASVELPASESSFLPQLAKSVGLSSLFAIGTEAAKHFLDGNNSTRRDTESTPSTLRFDGFPLPLISNNGDSNTSPMTPGQFFEDDSPVRFEQRAPGLEEAIEGLEPLDHSRREPLSASGLAKSGAGLLASLLASDAVNHFFGGNNTRREPQAPSSGAGSNVLNDALSVEEVISTLLHIKRRLAELD